MLWLRSITMRMPKLTSLIGHLPRLIDRVSNHDHLFIRYRRQTIDTRSMDRHLDSLNIARSRVRYNLKPVRDFS